MANTHIVELLTEANKKILDISNKMEREEATPAKHQNWIDGINEIIRNLDHIVEHLEKNHKE